MTTATASTRYQSSDLTCRLLPGEMSQVQPKSSLLQILCEAGAQGDTFTLKEVMHYLGQYIMLKQLYDKQRQHMVHCEEDPLGELLEVKSFSVKNPSPIYKMLRNNLIVLNCTGAAKTLSVAKDSNLEATKEEPGQRGTGQCEETPGSETASGSHKPPTVHRRHREPDQDSEDGQPYKRKKLNVLLEDWDLSGLPWWFLGNLRSNYSHKGNGSTDIHSNQDEDTAIVSDTTDDLWFLNEGESERVSIEMKEAALESDRGSEREEGGEKEMLECSLFEKEPEEDSQCQSDDTDTEVSIQDAWQCTECRKYNSPLQRYCIRCWALRKDWYKDCQRLVHAISLPDIPASAVGQEAEQDDGIDIPDCRRTVSDPIILPSHLSDRPGPPSKALTLTTASLTPSGVSEGLESSQGDSLDLLDLGQGMNVRSEAILEPCSLCHVRPRNGNIIHGRTAHLITCFSCARKLHKFRSPCPGCGLIIQRVIKIFVA
ncbi:protein Mdm4-like isoform X2 [Polyodon spathula]|uniref:protein Mdm4-like isoform X2 n=1 Tax=Polyodon spathula TaxID=7913 RepID=UPI001B7F1916|nr:protein Mdm4-like isoform X2 [Polyodon spathula]